MVDKLLVVQGVANRLYATEAALDSAMVESAQLVQSILSAKDELGISAGVVDAAVGKAAMALSTLATAREQLIASHEALSEVKLRLGIRTRMVGERPKHQQSGPVTAHLREVG